MRAVIAGAMSIVEKKVPQDFYQLTKVILHEARRTEPYPARALLNAETILPGFRSLLIRRR